VSTPKFAAHSVAAPDASQAVAELVRSDRASVIAALIRSCGGDFALAEDALQDALLVALERWPIDGGRRRRPAGSLRRLAAKPSTCSVATRP